LRACSGDSTETCVESGGSIGDPMSATELHPLRQAGF
jgi:hypothetical protein